MAHTAYERVWPSVLRLGRSGSRVPEVSGDGKQGAAEISELSAFCLVFREETMVVFCRSSQTIAYVIHVDKLMYGALIKTADVCI